MIMLKKPLMLAASLIAATALFGQCKGFTKRNCLPELAPYLSNGQLNAAQFTPGENAQVSINFNKGISYRLIVCADPYLEDLNYQLTNSSGIVFKSDTLQDSHSSADLKVNQTGPLNLSIKVPEKENATGIVRSGCVTILIGFKED